MRIADYQYMKAADKIQCLNSLEINSALAYFGGKSVIGRYLFNNIFNLTVQMKKDGKDADIFIDAFTGGGKISLSVPRGWYDKIVINDLDYGVASFYRACKDSPMELLKMIEIFGDMMSRDFFHLATYLRQFGPISEKWKNEMVAKEEVVDYIVAGAMTFWVTEASFDGHTDPEKASYKFAKRKHDEKGNILRDAEGKAIEDTSEERTLVRKAVNKAWKRIPKLHERLNSMNYVIENLDYRELLKKYNGKSYMDEEGVEQPADRRLGAQNKLWYFDPPYHPYCLYGGDDAPYAKTFSPELANEMVQILNGEGLYKRKDGSQVKYSEEFGQLEYFIKSDYDPQHALELAQTELNKKTLGMKLEASREKWYNELLALEKDGQQVSQCFKIIEEYPFCKICVGGFDKSVARADGLKNVGMEYIWCRGFSEGYSQIEGVAAKE